MATAPPLPAVDRLGQITGELLGVGARGLAEAGDTVMSYLSPGLPVLGDYLGQPPCSHSVLTAYVSSIQRENTLPSGAMQQEQLHRYGWVTMALATFTYGRCIQVYTPIPNADQQNQDGLLLQRYGWALWNALNYSIKHGYALASCRQYRMGSLTPITPSGGIAGWTLTVGFQIDGYDPFENDGV